MTEQVPRTVFVQSTRRKRPVEVLGIRFRIVPVSQARLFGVTRRTLDGKAVQVTDREKTLLDAAARPDLSGGIRHWRKHYGRLLFSPTHFRAESQALSIV